MNGWNILIKSISNQKLNLEIESLKSSRQGQVDEMNSILADLEPLLKNAGETNA